MIPHISLNWRNTRVYFHVSEVDYYSLLIIIESYQNSKNKRSGVNGLDTAKRLQLIRVIEKIEKNMNLSREEAMEILEIDEGLKTKILDRLKEVKS